MSDARGNGVSGDHVGTLAGLGVCVKLGVALGAADRVEVDAGSDGIEESGLESVRREHDLADGLRC